MASSFVSARLLYRLVEPEDQDFFYKIVSDPAAQRNANPGLSRPASREDAEHFMKAVQGALLGVVICLPPTSDTEQPIPIGTIHLEPMRPKFAHHRFTEIGIGIIKQYQCQGYGSEAIKWALKWAFETAGWHRVSIKALGWNEGAIKLYQRLGFKQEGVTREMWYAEGKFWDDFQYGMLDREWRELYGQS